MISNAVSSSAGHVSGPSENGTASPTLRAKPVAVQPTAPSSPTENAPASVSCRNDGTTRAISASLAPSRRHTAAVVRVVPTSTPSTYAKSLPHLFAAATSTYTGEQEALKHRP